MIPLAAAKQGLLISMLTCQMLPPPVFASSQKREKEGYHYLKILVTSQVVHPTLFMSGWERNSQLQKTCQFALPCLLHAVLVKVYKIKAVLSHLGSVTVN